MCVQVLRVAGMPYSVAVWIDDHSPDRFTVYVDKTLITTQGAASLEGVLRKRLRCWQRLDASFVCRALRAITG